MATQHETQQTEGGSAKLLAAPWEDTLEARVLALLRAGQPVVLVTIVASEGSAPRHAGTRALQTPVGFEGTVGGGLLEAETIKAARQCLAEGRSTRQTFVMDAKSATDSDMVCGGQMDVVCEFLRPDQAEMFATADRVLRHCGRGLWVVSLPEEKGRVCPERRLHVDALPAETAASSQVQVGLDAVLPLLDQTKQRPGLVSVQNGAACYVEPLDAPPVLLLCGGGHVSLEVARLAHNCGFVVDVVDDREEFANPERFPMARRCLVLPAFAGLVESCGIEPRHYVAIMTRGHAFDRETLEQALCAHPRYLGMIGSRSKKAHVYGLLRAAGVPAEELTRVCCPIGLGIHAETPQQIAVSVVAELLALQSGTLEQLRADR